MGCKEVLFTFYIGLGVISIGTKILHAGGHVVPIQNSNVGQITDYMENRELAPSGSFSLNHEGSFVAHIYRYRSCDGGWLISPMYRNSEGVELFSRQAVYEDYPVGDVFFVLDEKQYNEFPHAQLWLSQKSHIFQKMVGLNNQSLPAVFAMRTFGMCSTEENTG